MNPVDVVHAHEMVAEAFLDDCAALRDDELAILTAGYLVAGRLDVMLNVLDRIACSLDRIENELNNSSALA